MNSIIQTKEFKFTQEKQFKLDSETLLEMPISEHIAEFRQRLMHCFGFSVMAIGVLFFRITPIVKFLEAPVTEIKFIQLSPGEYFLSTVKIAFYGGLLISVPFLISQVILYILPGLTKPEKKIILPIIFASLTLFSLGLLFAYIILIPAALKFFIGYSKSIIEPLWSFDQYFDFVLFLFYSTGLSFQVPIFQVIIGLAGIVTGKQMLHAWRYVLLGTTIISAILTPSTDPVTQLFLAAAIFFLYFIGAITLVLYKK